MNNSPVLLEALLGFLLFFLLLVRWMILLGIFYRTEGLCHCSPGSFAEHLSISVLARRVMPLFFQKLCWVVFLYWLEGWSPLFSWKLCWVFLYWLEGWSPCSPGSFARIPSPLPLISIVIPFSPTPQRDDGQKELLIDTETCPPPPLHLLLISGDSNYSKELMSSQADQSEPSICCTKVSSSFTT